MPILYAKGLQPVDKVSLYKYLDRELSKIQVALSQDVYTVGTLPAAENGTRAFCSDLATAIYKFGDIVVGGGTRRCPVFSDGTNWREG
jgi:hypothetical protein